MPWKRSRKSGYPEKVALELRAMRSAPTTLRDYNGNKVGSCQFTEV